MEQFECEEYFSKEQYNHMYKTVGLRVKYHESRLEKLLKDNHKFAWALKNDGAHGIEEKYGQTYQGFFDKISLLYYGAQGLGLAAVGYDVLVDVNSKEPIVPFVLCAMGVLSLYNHYFLEKSRKKDVEIIANRKTLKKYEKIKNVKIQQQEILTNIADEMGLYR